MSTMDKARVQRIAKDMQAALEAVGEKHGVTIQVAGGRYDPSIGSFSPKVKVTLPDTAERDFAANAFIYGLTPEHFGQTFKSQGRTFKLTGFAHRSTKYPILAQDLMDGKTYKFSAAAVQRSLGIQSGPAWT